MATETVADVMTKNIHTVSNTAPVSEAAAAMRDHDVGDVLVMDNSHLRGVITDRDLVVRVLAAGKDPKGTTTGEVCSGDLITVRPTTPVDEAVQMMRARAVRRLPVVDHSGTPVGVVSLGDLAVSRYPQSALGDISAAKPNR